MKRCTRLCYVLRLLHLIYCSEKLRPTPTHKSISLPHEVGCMPDGLSSNPWCGDPYFFLSEGYMHIQIYIYLNLPLLSIQKQEREIDADTWMFKCPEIHKHTRHTHQLYEWMGPSTWNIGLVHGNKQTGKARRSNCLINVNHKCELLVEYETSRSK